MFSLTEIVNSVELTLKSQNDGARFSSVDKLLTAQIPRPQYGSLLLM